jgi:trk system potassium uptake protein TrkH
MRKEVTGVRLLLGYLGIFLIFEGLVTIFPLLLLAFYPSEIACWPLFVIPGVAGVVLGSAFFFSCIAGRPRAHFAKHEDALLLVLIWLFAILLGSMPFFLSQYSALTLGDSTVSLGMDFSESFFESMSGYTATGLTVLPSKVFLDQMDASSAYPCSHIFLFHRAFMQLNGGIGLVLIVAGALSDRYNLKLYFAEGHNDKLMPNLGKSAKLIFGIYFGYIVLGTLALWLSGMTVFDAFCHSTSALATGGFSTRAENFFYFANAASTVAEPFTGNGIMPGNPVAIEIIAMVLMLLGATNFVLHTFLFRLHFKDFFSDIEIRLSVCLLAFFILASTVSTMYLYDGGQGLDFVTSLRYSSFTIISSFTTTGYCNCPSLAKLGEVALFCGILAMCIGGGLGSTSGGIKQYRIALLIKDFTYSIRYRFSSPRTINPNPVYRLGEYKEEEPSTADEAHNYTLLYLVIGIVGSLALMFLPHLSFVDSLYMFNSAFSGTGLGPLTGTFAEYKAANGWPYYAYLWILSFAMLIGRLEVLPLHFAFQRLVADPIVALRNKAQKAKRNKYAD